ncbi:MAG TPA: hypothetical protein VMW66_02830 [Elusimicrobiales bacterium]|nr:hypothetical protein [Elusimicrobiales bacterium]
MPKEDDSSKEMDLIGNHKSSYDTVVLSSTWAKHLKNKDEFRHKPNSEIIKVAMEEVCSGKIKRKEILAVIQEVRSPRRYSEKPRDREEKK